MNHLAQLEILAFRIFLQDNEQNYTNKKLPKEWFELTLQSLWI